VRLRITYGSGADFLAALLAAVALAACGDNLPSVPPAPDTPPTDETLFSETEIWDVAIELPVSSRLALGDDPFTYVPADVTIGGVRFPDAGVRLKGTFSFHSLSGKAAFKIRLDRFREGQTLGSIRRLTLNNMWQSRGMVSEWLGYQVFAAAGVPAPRSGYARVTVDGDLFGLYANVETEDEVFLARHFDDPTGNLYEAELTDIVADELADYEQEQGEDTSRADLEELADAVAAGDGIFEGDPPLLDVGEFLGLVAGEALIGHWDGYWKAHNYRLYRDPGDGRWRFLPWGIDQSFERQLDPFDGAGVVTQACMASDGCLSRYAEVAGALAQAVDSGDLAARLEAVIDLIDGAVAEDPRAPYGAAKIRRHQAAIRDHLRRVPDALAARMTCAEGGVELDRDGDLHGDCIDDCDPDSDAAHPGAEEVCDGRDNDCDGKVDDLGGCGCQAVQVAGRDLLFCVHPMPWVDARVHCAVQGAELARFASAGESRAAFEAGVLLVRENWYFAATDGADEGTWRAGDEELPFEDWASDEPDSFGDEDCAVLDRFADGAWSDVRCVEAHPFVCQLAP
jgi:hypothetical protein